MKFLIQLASENQIGTIAFPAISTGSYNFPENQAAQIALKPIKAFLKKNELPRKVTFVCFDKLSLDHYKKALKLD